MMSLLRQIMPKNKHFWPIFEGWPIGRENWGSFGYSIDFKFLEIIVSKLNSKSGKVGEKLLPY